MVYRHFQQFLMKLYQTDIGKGLFSDEKTLIDTALRNSFGLFFLQIGLTAWRPFLGNCRLSQKILVDEVIVDDLFEIHVIADLNYLPFRKDTIDMAFLPHTLETVEDPYHLLRQIDDLLIAEGRLLITGFNPMGCAIWLQKMGENRQDFKDANLISPARVVDWLRLLGYEIEWVRLSPSTCVPSAKPAGKLALKIGGWLSKIGLETGNVYGILAKKRMSSPTPVGLNWRLSDWVRMRPLQKGVSTASNRQEKKQLKKGHKVKNG